MANFVKKKPVWFKYFPFPYEIWAENNNHSLSAGIFPTISARDTWMLVESWKKQFGLQINARFSAWLRGLISWCTWVRFLRWPKKSHASKGRRATKVTVHFVLSFSIQSKVPRRDYLQKKTTSTDLQIMSLSKIDIFEKCNYDPLFFFLLSVSPKTSSDTFPEHMWKKTCWSPEENSRKIRWKIIWANLLQFLTIWQLLSIMRRITNCSKEWSKLSFEAAFLRYRSNT